MNFISLINFSCYLFATYLFSSAACCFCCYFYVVVLKVSIVTVARQHSNNCTLEMVSMVIVL